jgi:hypothetical protein
MDRPNSEARSDLCGRLAETDCFIVAHGVSREVATCTDNHLSEFLQAVITHRESQVGRSRKINHLNVQQRIYLEPRG